MSEDKQVEVGTGMAAFRGVSRVHPSLILLVPPVKSVMILWNEITT